MAAQTRFKKWSHGSTANTSLSIYRAGLSGEDLVSLCLSGEDLVSLRLSGEDLVSLRLLGEDLVSLRLSGEDLVSLRHSGEDLVSLRPPCCGAGLPLAPTAADVVVWLSPTLEKKETSPSLPHA